MSDDAGPAPCALPNPWTPTHPRMPASTAAIVICRISNLRGFSVGIACPALSTRQSSVGHAITIEAVAETSQRDEIPGPRRVGLDLPPQVGHLIVDDAIGHVRVTAPDVVEELRARQHPAGCLDERHEQLVLERGQVDDATGAPELTAD